MVMGRAAETAGRVTPLALSLRLLTAVDLLDGEEVVAVLDAGVTAYGLPVTLEEIVWPSMREVGTRWSAGRCDVAQEQLATHSVLTWLAGRAAVVPPPLHERPIVLGCGPQDRHTLAVDAFTVLLREQRFDCRNLGAQTSAASLRIAVEQCSAQAVVLVCQVGRNRLAAATALESVRDSGAALFYAGAAFRTAASRHKMLGYYLGGNFSLAVNHVTTQLRHR